MQQKKNRGEQKRNQFGKEKKNSVRIDWYHTIRFLQETDERIRLLVKRRSTCNEDEPLSPG
jgi:hypothetical protein